MDLLHTTLNVTIGAISSAVSRGGVACGALGVLMKGLIAAARHLYVADLEENLWKENASKVKIRS